MRLASLIGHVAEILDSIRTSSKPADRIAQEFFHKRKYLGARDRRFITETLYGVIRNSRLLQTYLVSIGQSLENSSLSYCTAYCLKLAGQPLDQLRSEIDAVWRMAHPDIEITEFLEKIRDATLSGDIRKNSTKRISIQNSFPESIVLEWIDRFGENEANALCESLNRPAPTVLRVNHLATTREECAARLRAENVTTTPTTISPVGLVAEKRFHANSLRTFSEGLFEMQDEGSQIISLLVSPSPGEVVVDACAGGGGKSLHLASIMEDTGKVVAIDIDRSRLSGIADRVKRTGLTCIVPCHTTEYAGIVYEQRADRVLVDAPCSGSGTYRRNPDAKMRFQEERIVPLNKVQRSVLEEYAKLVRPGGTLVYATCSLLRSENEDIIEWFLKRHSEYSLRSASEALRKHGVTIDCSSEYLFLTPYLHGTDGFFAAVIGRNEAKVV